LNLPNKTKWRKSTANGPRKEENMNKYQKQISPTNQPKYLNKKPAHLKKNPLAHQA
jgi:hypothetical protein